MFTTTIVQYYGSRYLSTPTDINYLVSEAVGGTRADSAHQKHILFGEFYVAFLRSGAVVPYSITRRNIASQGANRSAVPS